MDPRISKWLPWLVAAVLALLLGWVLLNSSDADDAALGDPSTTTTTVLASTTTEPVTTTSLDATTTTLPLSTTTSQPATTTTELATTTTTTVAPVPVITLTNEGVQAGDVWLYFGYDADDTVAAVAAVLGAPTRDSGWVEDFLCPAPVVRTVKWNDLWLLFTQAETDFWSAGVPHFFTFYYSGPEPYITTTEGIGLGSTLAMLDDAYGGPDLVIADSPFDASNGTWSYRLAPWTGLWGYTTGQTAGDTVTAINGGQGCGE